MRTARGRVLSCAPSHVSRKLPLSSMYPRASDVTVGSGKATSAWESGFRFSEAEVAFHDPTVTSLALGYMDESGNFRDTWDGAQDKTLPRAVRITVSTTLNGQTQTLPPLTVSLRVGTE